MNKKTRVFTINDKLGELLDEMVDWYNTHRPFHPGRKNGRRWTWRQVLEQALGGMWSELCGEEYRKQQRKSRTN